VDRLMRLPGRTLALSAHTGEGVEELITLITELLPRPQVDVELLVPYSRGDLLHRAHRDGVVLEEDHRSEGTWLVARVGPGLAAELKDVAESPVVSA